MSNGAIINPYLGVIFILLIPLSIFIVYYYMETGFPWHTKVSLTIGYYASFAILLLVPIDIASVVHDRHSKDYPHDESYDFDVRTLSTAYDTFFTIILIMGSVVLVFEEYYNSDGYFTIRSKMWSAFKRLCIDSAMGLVAGLIVLGIILGQHILPAKASALKLTAVIVTNIVYEFFLMFLLAYAFIEFPRSIWAKSNLDAYLLKTQQKAAADFKNISEAQLTVSLVVSDILKTKSSLSGQADPQLLHAMDILTSECPPEFRSDRMGKVAVNKKGQVTVDSLAELRTRLNETKSQYRMAQAKSEETKIRAYMLEDIVKAKNENAAVIHYSLSDTDSTVKERDWEIKHKPILLRITAVLAGMMTLFSFLGVVCSMNGVSNSGSVYYIVVHRDGASVGGIAFFMLFTLGFTTYITFWSLFQMRFAGMMELVPYRTTPASLSFNVRMIARLAAPLAFFYLGWIAENGMKSGSWQYNNAPYTYANVTYTYPFNATSLDDDYMETTTVLEKIDNRVHMPSSFSKFYQLDSVHAIKQSFGTIFPIVLFVLLFLFATNVFNRFWVLVKMPNLQFGDEIVTDEQLREGKRQLQRHKKGTERAYRRQGLKSLISNFGKEEEQGFFGRIFGGRKGGSQGGGSIKASGDSSARDSEIVDRPTVREPAPTEGIVERKGSSTLGISASWKEAYALVRSPGYLHICKDKRTMDMARSSGDASSNPDPHATVINLRLVMDFSIPDRKNKENLELDLELSDDTIKLKFNSTSDVEKWKKQLMEWKDFNIDFGTTYPNGMSTADVEKGGGNFGSGHGTVMKNPISSLAAPQHEYDDEDDNAVRPLMMESGSSKSTSNKKLYQSPAAASAAAFSSPSLGDDKPAYIEGWVEKKGGGKMAAISGGEWQKRYMRIDEAKGGVAYSKTSNLSEKPSGVIDLRSMKEVTPYEKNGVQDFTRFNIDIGEKVFKFRVGSAMEGERWVSGLQQWQDYFLLNM